MTHAILFHMNSTLEIFWIVLAFCALWITAFICWAVYHIAMIARRVHIVLDEAKLALDQIEMAISRLREKMEHHSKILDPLVKLAGVIVHEVKGRKMEKEDREEIEHA